MSRFFQVFRLNNKSEIEVCLDKMSCILHGLHVIGLHHPEKTNGLWYWTFTFESIDQIKIVHL